MAKLLVTIVFILSTLTRQRVCAVPETASTVWQSAHTAVKSLGDDVYSYLVSLFGKQAVDTLQEIIRGGIKEISQAASHALNAVAAYISELLIAAEIGAKLQKLLTLEGVVFVAKFVLLVVPGYWLLFRAVWLFAAVIRAVTKLALLPLKFTFATGKVFKNIKGLAKQLKEIKRKKKKNES